jgi:hypothetical protein
MGLPALVERLADREAGDPSSPDAGPERRSIRTDLRHRCLPKLEAAGWIERGPEGISATDPPPTGLAVAGLTLPDIRAPDHPCWDAVGVVLSRPRRLDPVRIVADRRDRLTLAELVEALRERDDGHGFWPTTYEETRTVLHHVDLPTLSDVALLAYDATDRTVAEGPRLATFVERTDLALG